MERKYAERLNKSFGKTLLDTPVPNRKIKFFPTKKGLKSRVVRVLPEPDIKPEKCVPPAPKPKPRTQKSRLPPPVPLPRSIPLPKPKEERIQKEIDKFKPIYGPEAKREFERSVEESKLVLEKIAKERKRRKLSLKLKELIKEKGRALKNSAKSFEVLIIERGDPAKQLYYTITDVAKVLKKQLKIKKGLKAYVTLQVKFKKKKIDDGEVYFEFKNAHFNSKVFTVYNSGEITDALDQASEDIKNIVAISEGSGWAIEEILSHYVNIVNYVPLRGSSYLSLPKDLRHPKKGLINLKNSDQKCFLWCHVRHSVLQEIHPERITQSDREFEKRLDYSGITFPVTIKQICQIERQNEINVSLFGYDKSVYLIRISKEKYEDHMELLYIERESKTHYVYIKDFDR